MISILAAGIAVLAAQAGQSISQWINSPAGQKALRDAAKIIGQGALQELFKKLGL